MRRQLRMAAALAVLSLLLPVQASAQYWKNAKADFSVVDNVSGAMCHYKYTYTNNSWTTKDGNVCLTSVEDNGNTKVNALKEFTIPSSVTYNGTNYPVVAVGNQATTAKSVTNQSAFSNCTALEKLTIPASIKELGKAHESANFSFNFSQNGPTGIKVFVVDQSNATYCSVNGVVFTNDKSTLVAYPIAKIDGQDSTYTVPKTTTAIGYGAFYKARLKKVVLQEGITTIGAYAFRSNMNLKEITLPNTLTTIRDNAFDHCEELPTISIPNSVTSIGRSAFETCRKLDNITVPSSVTVINERVFIGCASLKNITLPNTLTEIRANAFQNCRSLPKIDLNELTSLTTIGEGAFSTCMNLNDIVIPSSVTSIGNYAFGFCASLTKFNIPADCTLGTGVLINTPRLATIDNQNTTRYTLDKSDGLSHGILYGNSNSDGNKKDELVYFFPANKIGAQNKEMIRQFIVPNHVRKICAGSMGIHNIESLILPSELTTIEPYAFARFWSVVNPNNQYVTYTDEDKKILQWNMTEITIPAKVTTLYLSSFLQQRVITSGSALSANPSTIFKNIFLMGTPNVNMGTDPVNHIHILDNVQATFSDIFNYKQNNVVQDVVKVFVKKSKVDESNFNSLKTRIGDRFGYNIPLDDRLTTPGQVITMCRDFDVYFPYIYDNVKDDKQIAKPYILTEYEENENGYGTRGVNYIPSRTGANADQYHGFLVKMPEVSSEDKSVFYQIGEMDYSQEDEYDPVNWPKDEGRIQSFGLYRGDNKPEKIYDEHEPLTANRLRGVVANSHVQGTEGELTNWGLSSGKFQRIVNTGRLTPYNRAYLQPTAEETAKMLGKGDSGEAKIAITFNDDNGSTTAITDINNEEQRMQNSHWYTLDGRRLTAKPAQKGIYIHNGRKEVIR